MRSVFRATGNARHVQLLLLGLLIAAMAFTGCSRRVPSSTPHPPPPSPEESRATRPKPYKVLGKWYQPLSNSRGYYEKGIASWYGKKFHGRKTANGETYNMYGLSAAHKTLPLGTWVRVKNLQQRRHHGLAHQRPRAVRTGTHHRSFLRRRQEGWGLPIRERHRWSCSL
jgi:hypothetical protein